MISKANTSDIANIMNLWNDQHWIYQRVNEEDVEKWINDDSNLFFLSTQNGLLEGFIFGNHRFNKPSAYLSMIVVKEEFRRMHIGTSLVHHWVDELKHLDQGLEKIEIVFFDPNQFPWKLTNLMDVTHPNAPGVHMNPEVLSFFENQGFTEYARQEVFYQNITDYKIEPKVDGQRILLEKDLISIQVYDPKRHIGFYEYFESNQALHWYHEAQAGLNLGQNVLALLKKNKVIGFTGPLSVESTKRGYFAGIGIDHHFRGLGLGTILFQQLCYELSQLGASYMTLYTGTTNPASNIYLNSGFYITDTFVNLRKMLI